MFDQLVHRYERGLYDFICRVSGDEASAPDLFQETFLRVFQRAQTFQGRSSFKSWLFAIAANLCRTHLSKRGAPRTDVRLADPEPANGSAPPPDASQAKEVGERISEAVAALPADQREVFVLRMYHDLSYPEIAQSLERPVGTVKSQMRYAIQKLRATLHQLAHAYEIA